MPTVWERSGVDSLRESTEHGSTSVTACGLPRSQADSYRRSYYGILKTTLPKLFPWLSRRYASGAFSMGKTLPITGRKCPFAVHAASCFQDSLINSRFADR